MESSTSSQLLKSRQLQEGLAPGPLAEFRPPLKPNFLDPTLKNLSFQEQLKIGTLADKNCYNLNANYQLWIKYLLSAINVSELSTTRRPMLYGQPFSRVYYFLTIGNSNGRHRHSLIQDPTGKLFKYIPTNCKPGWLP